MKETSVVKRVASIILAIMMSAPNIFGEATGNTSYTIEADVVFWNNSGYNEHIVANKSILGIDLKVTNNSDADKIIQPYFALYKNGLLTEIKKLTKQTVAPGASVDYNDSIYVNAAETQGCTAKVFNWESGSVKPLSEAAFISGVKADFYGDNIVDAALIRDFNKEVVGAINMRKYMTR